MRKLIFAINSTLDGCCDHTKQMADEETHDYFTHLMRDVDLLVSDGKACYRCAAGSHQEDQEERTMKYICLGYIEPGKFEGMTEAKRHAVLDECFEYNDHLRANGHLVAEVPLQPSETALTLYWKNGKVATTDGPYAETKEQLGGLQILEARDLNHAIQLVSQLPGFKYGLGPVEIRPVADLNEIIKESERRRRKDTAVS
jgi:hypothetical protein